VDNNEQLPNMTPEQALAILDDDQESTPPMPLAADLPTFWRFQDLESNGGAAVIVTIANPAFPQGIPFVLDRERGLKFASQLKKRLSGGPAKQRPLTVAQKRLIVPGQ